jgi:hypothetical protein
MLSLSAIRQLSRDAAVIACRQNKIPFIFEQEDIDDLKAHLAAGRTIQFLIPLLGDYLPQGWRYTDRQPLFVDTTGFGREDEPAMTTRAFVEALEPGKGYAVIECGESQAFIREYERDDSSEGNADRFLDLTSDEEQEFEDEFSEQPRADVEIRFEGTICLFEPHTRRGKTWIHSHVAPGAQWWGRSLVVEHRYAKEIAKAMKSAGLKLA